MRSILSVLEPRAGQPCGAGAAAVELTAERTSPKAQRQVPVTWPNGHRFAFTVIDDTDFACLANVKPVYDLLAGSGMRTTKTAWMFRGEGQPVDGGATCEEPEYLEWVLSLKQQGFEIAFHNAAPCTSGRELTNLALGRFHDLFGPQELLFCNHVSNRENLYWGDARFSGWRRTLYNLATVGRRRHISRGHIESDPLFWGDLSQRHVRYVRGFVFNELNALSVCPELPYHDPTRPYVNFWFPSSDGGTLNWFLANYTVQRLEQLRQSGGLCIAYVHFAEGFAEQGVVHPEFRKRLEFLASLDGWFVPASTILDYLRQGQAPQQRVIAPERLCRMERQWLLEKLFKGTT